MKLVTLLLAIAVLSGCGEPQNRYQSIDSHPVDQVFRDTFGIRIYHTTDSGEYVEHRYNGKIVPTGGVGEIVDMPESVAAVTKIDAETLLEGFTILRDLDAGTRGYVNVMHYTRVVPMTQDSACTYVEIHLPKKQVIFPGNEKAGTIKYPKYHMMSEIK